MPQVAPAPPDVPAPAPDRALLLLGLDGAGKSRLAALLAAPPLATDAGAFHAAWAALPAAPSRDGFVRLTQVHPGRVVESEAEVVGVAAPLPSAASEGPLFAGSAHAATMAAARLLTVDPSGAQQWRYRWRLLGTQPHPNNGALAVVSVPGHYKASPVAAEAVLFVVDASDAVRLPLAWTELLAVAADCCVWLARPLLVVVARHGPLARVGVGPANGDGNGDASGGERWLTAVDVLRACEDFAPLPAGVTWSVVDADFRSPEAADVACAAVASWCAQ